MIEPTTLAQIAAAVARSGESALGELRCVYPGMIFSSCSDDDVVNVRPAFEHPAFNLYFLDATDHCLRLCNDADCANGVVVAWVDAAQD